MKSVPELMDKARDALSTAGLVFDELDCSGEWAYCGTAQKPNGTDGRYKVHLDFPPNVLLCNYHDGAGGVPRTVPLYDKGVLDAMPAAERDALRERIRQEKENAAHKAEEARAKAAGLARTIWKAAPAATDAHPYLTRKGVPSLGLKQARDGGQLIVPVLDESGTAASLQFIAGDGSKRFLKGGRTEGGFFPIPAKDGSRDGPLLIAEGYATAASLHLATGHAVSVAFNAGNLRSVARLAREQHPQREITVCADNDVETKGNPGVTKATEAAAAVGAKLAVPPAHEGRTTDFNDLHCRRSLEAVRATVEEAAAPSGKNAWGTYPMPEGYRLRPVGKRAGLYAIKIKETDAGSEEVEIYLGPPLFARGTTRDETGNAWGLWLEWEDPDGAPHTWSMPLTLLAQQGANWFGMLMDGGWLGDPAKRRLLERFFIAVRPKTRVRCVPRVGWHKTAFVLPDTVIGETGDERVVLQSTRHARMYRTGGTPEGWRELAALAVGNSRLTFALSAAFAGPLLHLSGQESGGFNFVGGSSTGKSTVLKLAASVWDGPEYVRSWRTTDNALESAAAFCNDGLLVLDELGQAAAKTVSEAAYMLTNGQGKSRANRDGIVRAPMFWRLLFLSSGEVGLADKLTEIGQRPRAGQEVRLVDVPADAGAGMGVFEELHDLPDAGTLSLRIKELAATHYGHAGRAFLAALVEHRDEMAEALSPALDAFMRQVCPTDADGQVKRVAMRCGICGMAGTWAVQWGVVPWPREESMRAAAVCFKAWLDTRGGTGASEDAAILAAVRLFIEQHGASRFQDMDAADGAQRCINRVGFRRRSGENIEYIILPESFKTEVIKGHNAARAARVLAEAGWLRLLEKDRFTVKMELPGMGKRTGCYVVTFGNAEAA